MSNNQQADELVKSDNELVKEPHSIESEKQQMLKLKEVESNLSIEIIELVLQEFMALPEDHSDHLFAMQPIAQLAQLRRRSPFWKLSVENYFRHHLKTLTIEVDMAPKYSLEEVKEMIRNKEPRREKTVLSLDEAMSLSVGTIAKDFERIISTLDSRRRPTVVYEVLKNGPLLRLAGIEQLKSFVRFLKAITNPTNEFGERTVIPMKLESLSLVILELDKKSEFETKKEMSTIEALLDHFTRLKQLVFSIFTDNRFKGARPFRNISQRMVKYLARTRAGGPLEKLELNFNEAVHGDPEDYSGLKRLMPQLAAFGLNAEVTGRSLVRLLNSATSRLTSLKMNVMHCTQQDLLSEEREVHHWNFSRANFDSVTSLTLIDRNYGTATKLMLHSFPAVTSLVLGEKAVSVSDKHYHTFSVDPLEDVAMPSLTSLTLVGFYDTIIPQQVIRSISQLTDLTLVQCRFSSLKPHKILLQNTRNSAPLDHAEDEDVDYPLFQNICTLSLLKAVHQQTTREKMPNLQAFTNFERVEGDRVQEVEEKYKESLVLRRLRSVQLYLRSGYPVPNW